MRLALQALLVCAALLRRDRATQLSRWKGSRDVLANLKQVLATRGEAGCVKYVNSTLTSLAVAYTEVHVPPTLHQVCRQGTFFHIFPSEDACATATDALIAEFETNRTYGKWCGDIATLVNATVEEPASAAAANATPAGPASQPNATLLARVV